MSDMTEELRQTIDNLTKENFVQYDTAKMRNYIDGIMQAVAVAQEDHRRQVLAEVLRLRSMADDKPYHTDEGDWHMCNTCDRVLGDDSDYDSKCLCQYRNELRDRIRAEIEEDMK
jgi:hypothetical protein